VTDQLQCNGSCAVGATAGSLPLHRNREVVPSGGVAGNITLAPPLPRPRKAAVLARAQARARTPRQPLASAGRTGLNSLAALSEPWRAVTFANRAANCSARRSTMY